MSEDQINWKNMIKELGEDSAKKEIARQLRLFADFVESDTYPDIFGVKCLPIGSTDLESFIGSISVILSYPWPG